MELISTPFRDWKNAVGSQRGTLNKHANSVIHKDALTQAEKFLAICNNERLSIASQVSTAYNASIQRNRTILLSILDVITTLAVRGIPLRGNWNSLQHRDDGNFDYFIEWKSRFDSILRNHLDSSPRNARYLSPQIQNELISCLGDEIRESVVKQIEKSKFYSVMADETTDESTKTQLSICVRYLTDNFEVEEAFLGFVDLHKTDAETISEVLIDNVQQWGSDSSKWRGQGYDGASTMSGHVSGVQARITSKLPKAKFFVHCRSHCLNLTIVASCSKVPEIRNFMDTFKSITFFFSASPKRKGILSEKLSESAGNDLLADSGLSAGTEDDQFEDVIALRANKNRYHLPTLSDQVAFESRFDQHSVDFLIPSKLHLLDETVVAKIEQSLGDELPNNAEFGQEVLRWKMKNNNSDAKKIQSLQHAVIHCNESFYPNISTILQLLLTLPVGSCSCERSFSSLRRLKTWSRTSMANARLNGPALAYIHKPTEIDSSSVLKRWDASGHRRIVLAFSKE
ncbi:zinc finger MYM-type protein 1-like [Montipora capricornis]|uniref:zinc finger MYM-type protein 1-like n=1 Tax=Montipora capricornis TaxID=246305 RepID=UPI0035F11BCC